MDRRLKVVPGSDGRVAEALNCVRCKGGNAQVRIASVEIDQASRRVVVDEKGPKTTPRRPEPDFDGPTVMVRLTCRKGHDFFLRLDPTLDGHVLLATFRPKYGRSKTGG